MVNTFIIISFRGAIASIDPVDPLDPPLRSML